MKKRLKFSILIFVVLVGLLLANCSNKLTEPINQQNCLEDSIVSNGDA